MYVKGYTSNKPHVKAAKISGGVIADFWPHGSTAVYETFARMSQSWINNMPEVDWHGANGSIQISGEPAADRYCEARLSKSTEDGLLYNIKKENVPMRWNFSEDMQWPSVLPAIYPRLLVNGCQGIGSTIANCWLPNSLDELAEVIQEYLSSGDIDYSKLAPSFPTGGIIINKKDMPTIYKTGKGKVILRGTAEIKGKDILITEMPYQVYVEPYIDSLKQLIVKDEIKGISDILNKSNKKQLCIEIKCDAAPETVLKQLYQKTDLQKSYSANQYALVGKTPKLLNFKEYLDIFLQHTYDCIKREAEFDLNKSESRLEIVEGLVKALEDIDNIIALIKQSVSSNNAVENLIKKYEFTEKQAAAIVNMKLGKLARLEKVELNKERADLILTIANCLKIIDDEAKRKEIFLERFLAFVKKYPCPRKTKLMDLNVSEEKKEAPVIEPEECVVVMTANGSIKRVAAKSFKTQNRSGKGVKTQEDITTSLIRTNTIDQLLIFSDKGKLYKITVDDIPAGTVSAKGVPISALVKMDNGEKATAIYSVYPDTNFKYICLVTKGGKIKKTSLEECCGVKKKSGVSVIKLAEGDEVASAFLLDEEEILVFNESGKCLHTTTAEIAATGRTAQGVKIMEPGIQFALPIRKKTDDVFIITANGIGKRVPLSEFSITSRTGKGVIVYKPAEAKIVAAAMVESADKLLINGTPRSICIEMKDINCSSRTAMGISIIKDSTVTAVTKY